MVWCSCAQAMTLWDHNSIFKKCLVSPAAMMQLALLLLLLQQWDGLTCHPFWAGSWVDRVSLQTNHFKGWLKASQGHLLQVSSSQLFCIKQGSIAVFIYIQINQVKEGTPACIRKNLPNNRIVNAPKNYSLQATVKKLAGKFKAACKVWSVFMIW